MAECGCICHKVGLLGYFCCPCSRVEIIAHMEKLNAPTQDSASPQPAAAKCIHCKQPVIVSLGELMHDYVGDSKTRYQRCPNGETSAERRVAERGQHDERSRYYRAEYAEKNAPFNERKGGDRRAQQGSAAAVSPREGEQREHALKFKTADQERGMSAAEQSHAEGAREQDAPTGVLGIPPLTERDGAAERWLRARWLGDCSAIPQGKVFSFLDEYAREDAASRLRAVKPWIRHYVTCTSVQPKDGQTLRARIWQNGDESTCTCGLAKALREG